MMSLLPPVSEACCATLRFEVFGFLPRAYLHFDGLRRRSQGCRSLDRHATFEPDCCRRRDRNVLRGGDWDCALALPVAEGHDSNLERNVGQLHYPRGYHFG